MKSITSNTKEVNPQNELNFYKAAYYDLETATAILERLHSTYSESWSSWDSQETESILQSIDQTIKKVWNFENEKRLLPWQKLSKLAQSYFRFIAKEKVVTTDDLAAIEHQGRNFEKYLAIDELIREGLIVTVESYLCLTSEGQTVRQALIDREEVF